MKNKKPKYEELGKKLAEAEKLIAKLQENRISIDKHEHDSSLLSTKELAEAFIASEQNFKNSMDECPLGVRIVTEDGDLIYANKAALKTFGYRTVEDLAAAKRSELYTPESYAAHQERRKRRKLKEYVPGEYEISIRRPNGDIRNLRVYRREVMWGGEQQFMAMYEDITERKRAEGALRESEDKFHNIVEHSNDGIVFIEEGIIQYCNSKMLEISGYTAGELIGTSFIDFVAPEQKERVLETYRKRLAGEEVPVRYELNIIAKTGSIVYTEISASLFTLKQKMVDIVIVRDISQRRKVLETLRQSEEMFAKAFRSSPDAVTITTFDEAAIIIDTNDTAVKNTGYSFSEMIGHSVLDLNLWANLEDRKKMHQLIIENGRVDREEYQFRKKTGELRTWEFSAEPIVIGGRKCIISVQRDITEQKQAQEALKEGEETFAKAFFNSPSLMAISTVKDGRIVEVNDIYCRVTGYNREELIGHTTSELNLWCDPEQRKAIVKTMEKKGMVHDSEVQMRTKSGKIQTINLSTAKIMLKNEPCLLTIAADITERKRAEEAVRESEREKAAILNGVSELVTYQDRELKVIWANRSAGESVGTSPEELVGRHCYEIWQNRSEPCEDCPVVKSFETGRPHQTEMSSPNGRKWFVRGYPVQDEKGNVSGVTEVTLEITERKKSEEALKESEARFRALFETMAQGVVYQNADGKIISANPAAGRILGLTIEQILGRESVDPRWKSIHEDGTDFPGEEHPSMVALRTGKPVDNVIMGVFNPILNERRWILISAIPEFKEGEDSPYRAYTTFTDITEQKHIEKSLQESEERYRLIFENSQDAILLTHPNGEILAANPAACRMFGRSEEEICRIGRSGVIDTSDPRLAPALEKRRVTGEFTGELTLIYADGTKFPGDISSRIFYDKDGKEKTSMIVRDITERKKMEETLEEEREDIKLIIDSSPILVFYKDMKGKFLRVNKAFATALNMTEEDFLGKTVYDLYSKQIAQGMTDDDNEVFKTGRSKLNVIEQYESASGLRWVQTDKIPIFDKSGKVSGLVGFALDVTERKRAEEALISSETRYRRLFESAKDGILILNAETGQIIDANPFLLDMLGFSFAEIVGKELWEIGLFKDIAADKEDFLKLQNKGYIRYENLPLESKDGTKRDVEFVSNVYQVNDTRVVQCNIRDITERKLAAEALQESEERFNKAFHASPNLMAVINLENGQIIEVNEQHSRITGFERHEVIGKTTLELNLWVYPEKREEFYRIINTKGRLADLEVLMRSKSNEIKTLLYSAEKISLRGINCIVTVALDITERKEAEERISHLNLTLRAIRDVDQLITREKDRDLLIQSVCDSLVISRSFNSAWIVLLDEKQQPLAWAGANMSKEFPALVKMMRQNEMPSCVVKALKQKRVVVTEEPHKTCQGCPALSDDTDIGSMTIRLEIEGKIYGVFCTSIPKALINDKDEISLFTEVATDIAFALRDIDLVAANELLVQERLRMAKLESIGMLAGGIAHDFNNLLTGIMGNIGLAKTYISTSDNTYEMLDEAERAALRAKDLTQQLLTFARGGKPVKKPVNTYELIRESAEFGLRGSKAKLILSLPEDVWQIEADEGQISQVINNLVINADEAMPAGGTLRIHAENEVLKKNTAIPIKTGNYVRIDIEDTGIGISPEHLQRIFEPYFTTKQRGSGLGLTTAYSVVRNHGGIILAESVRKKGSIFRIYLPATKRTVKGGKKLTAIDSGQAGGKVLIMDDEEIIRKMLTNMLGMAGYTVEVSADGAEALEKYKQAKASGDPFNAVIMDLTVPGGMGGKEAVKKLLEIDPKATVIVSSGYATDPIMSDFKKYGFKAVIAKPYSVRQLRESLSNMLTKKKR